MNSSASARREFLKVLSGSAGAAWLTANWPSLLSAAEHAHQAASSTDAKFEVLTAEQARELEALTSRLIPSDDAPGAREAGVVYFIDRGLKSFASDSLPVYEEGLAGVQEHTTKRFPGVARFSAASADQQDQILTELFAAAGSKDVTRRLILGEGIGNFIELLRVHTIFGYLVDPSGGGNRDYAGWKAIGRDPAHMFSPPFGFYDKNYPGWQAASGETDKK